MAATTTSPVETKTAAAATPAKKTAPVYKLSYFNIRGLAEPTRLLFAAADVAYEDYRVDRESKDWEALKPNTPFQQLPTLEVNGKTIAQSQAIQRFVAREHGLFGSSDLEGFSIDAFVEAIMDAREPFGAARRIKDETERKAKFATIMRDEWPKWATKFNAHLAANNEGKGYFVGTKISLADIFFFNTTEFLVGLDAGAISSFPLLVAHNERVRTNPGIAAWLAKRPKTAF